MRHFSKMSAATTRCADQERLGDKFPSLRHNDVIRQIANVREVKSAGG